jgi:hypothetical protein
VRIGPPPYLLVAGAIAGDPHERRFDHVARLVLDHGRRWQTDEPLRQGMDNIRGAVAKALNAYGEHFEQPGWKRI